MIRDIHEVQKLETFEERYRYLRLTGLIGESTFGFDRYLNQSFYTSTQWKRVRDLVIIRDNGCDLGLIGFEIRDRILIHHMNPIKPEDITKRNPDILNPDFLICTSKRTHLAIHYGDQELLQKPHKPRRPGDTNLW